MNNRSYDYEEEIIEQKPSQSPQMIEELNFNKRETITMKQIKQLFEETEPDWERIKNVQGMYIIMLALQNVFSLWILLLLYLMNLGNVIANYIKYPVDLVFIFIYLYCLIQIQFKQHDWRTPPFNYLLYMAHAVSRTLLSIFVIFRFTYIHLEIVYIMVSFDFIIVFLCFQIDKRSKQECFLAKDYWWRALLIFMIQEILVNLVYAVYTWIEVFAWFFAYFMILCYVLWECQMIRFRPHMNYYFNAFYLGQIYFDSDIMFPCSLIKLFRH
ncbi:unnamed protein product [Paramecium sonneborni]|uniref:Transmembrane protein n=1 Tax=Paramecium sonneborni TaxID=65129 RepID=A0A8S1LFV6_9CILI|nr:unnamed protein product [Paramecium sonneborni]